MFQVDENDPVGELEPSFPCRDVAIKRNVDMKEFFELQTEIGRGKFGTVYRVCEKQTGLQLAAKFVATPKREDRRNVEREVDIMRSLQHPRLIQLYDAFDYNNVMCVVLEIIEGGELFERVIDDDFVLTEKACTVFMRQICEGVDFIHQQNILHLDLKPENILCLTRTGNRIKIIDFGLARRYDSTKKLQVLFGTPEFVAPEIVNFEQIGFGTDMWSVGVICYVLLSGLSPFMGETDVETMANVTVANYDFDDEVFNDVSEDAKEFIQQLLLKDRDARLGARACLTHPWLRRRPAAPPPSQPVAAEEQLATAQDNLRVFVDRWTEHPDSPYAAISTPSPAPPRPRSSSLSANSPSPCGSLSSSPESSFPENNQFPPHMFTNFERRASDSSCVLSPTSDTATRVSLADEIRKLSDKLFQMATLHSAEEPIRPPAFLTKYSNPTNEEPPKIKKSKGKSKSNKISIHSRDVVGSGSPPPDTKDLLLHLLDRWDDTSPPTEQCSGRKSFSIEWAREDSRTIGQRSMTSLASYFQATSQNVQKKRTLFQTQFGV